MRTLFAAAVASDNAEGETPLIPDSIMKLSVHNSENTDLGTTLKVLSSPNKNIRELDGETKTDPIVRCAPTPIVASIKIN